jgi:hypothetical protein
MLLNPNKNFGANNSYMNVFFDWIGLMICLNVLKPETAGLYSVTFICL